MHFLNRNDHSLIKDAGFSEGSEGFVVNVIK